MTDYDKITELIRIKCINNTLPDAVNLLVEVQKYCENLLSGSNLSKLLDESLKEDILNKQV
jgi:hypothetical protein